MPSQYPQKREWGGVVAQWLAVAAIVVPAIFWLASLEEAKDVAVANHAEQQRTLEKQEERIHALETSRALEIQIAKLAAEVAGLKAEVNALRDEFRARRR